jgi:hypothetical protein
MSKAGKISLGVFTFLPYLLLGIYFVTMPFFIKDIHPVQYGHIPFPLMTDVIWMLFILILAGVFAFGLLVWYIIHAFHNTELNTQERYTWISLMILVSFVICPLYWYSRIWKTHDTLYMAAS